MNITIVMAYYDRQEQLDNTLRSIKPIDNLSIVIVDDASPEPIILPDVDLNIKVIRIDPWNKVWTNPEPVYNTGFKYAIDNFSPDIIIIQNPECKHIGDIVQYALENTTDLNYITYSCFSIHEQDQINNVDINEIIPLHQHKIEREGERGWYNHPVHKPCYYEFCASISVKNLIELNGYDERLAFGVGYGDVFFLHRVKLLGLELEIPENPFVLHQWHTYNLYNDQRNYLSNRNRSIEYTIEPSAKIRAEHLLTLDLV